MEGTEFRMMLVRLFAVVTLFGLTEQCILAQQRVVFKAVEYWQTPAPGRTKGVFVPGSLEFDSGSREVRFTSTVSLRIGYDSVKKLLYERTATPRYAAGILIGWPLLFTKSKKHFLTIYFSDEQGNSRHALLRLHKDNFRHVLAESESALGPKVERIQER